MRYEKSRKAFCFNYPPYNPLQSFVPDNHLAVKDLKGESLSNYVFGVKDILKLKAALFLVKRLS
ncbi:hypothetical protein SAMN04488700_0595 [Carnobacterium iners]|uniref:Uncharacterized protein n=1 Tax=Carnobacterium iners TaxID=1073423 RepID=A0A1X7MTC9_9LACT|nr:hypothetical protein SAMN04488114_1633 [Carnobacterium iners]SMH27296.1 hypothetical protein SAMN04488700_0595 [Carnobacterium iners]